MVPFWGRAWVLVDKVVELKLLLGERCSKLAPENVDGVDSECNSGCAGAGTRLLEPTPVLPIRG